ncbi:hypothetical protein ONZ45_g11274 [Pleurotus djamor]|nr:hypothetical protein ONZ45_g11274 [Pleurotus djamor]
MLARYPSAFSAARGYHRPENIYFNILDASSPVDVSFTINNGGIRIMMCIFDLASPSINQTVKVFVGGLGMNVFMCSFNILGSELSSKDTVLSADRSKFGGEEELKNLVVGVYGWEGETSYGVLLEKGNAISPSGYGRCARGQIEGLPSANAVRESGIQPKFSRSGFI